MAATFPMPATSDVICEAAPPRKCSPPVGQFYRENTTYAGQNGWMRSQDRRGPLSMSDGQWQRPTDQPSRRPVSQMGMDPSSEYFQQYMKLMNRMAYRYPNPGPPRTRNGNVGSNWRHIRQVMSYGGNNVCYVDGVVKQYDLNNMNQELSGRRPYQQTHVATPLYALNHHDINHYRQHVAMETEKQTYRPWQQSLPPIQPAHQRH